MLFCYFKQESNKHALILELYKQVTISPMLMCIFSAYHLLPCFMYYLCLNSKQHISPLSLYLNTVYAMRSYTLILLAAWTAIRSSIWCSCCLCRLVGCSLLYEIGTFLPNFFIYLLLLFVKRHANACFHVIWSKPYIWGWNFLADMLVFVYSWALSWYKRSQKNLHILIQKCLQLIAIWQVYMFSQ